VKEQLVDILDLPEVYGQLVGLMAIQDFESDALIEKSAVLKAMLHAYCED
jgi:hypothetical protein